MSIIDIIFENPIIILVIMGILSSLFSKKKHTEPTRRNERIPPKRTVNRNQAAERKRVSPPPHTQAQTQAQNTQPITISAETNELIQRAELAEAKMRKEQESENLIKLGAVEHSDLTKKKYKLDPKSDQVLQGLIWAEVLAAPKAKRKRNI
ncbi:hypothetical protein SAMN05877753_10275 [Bacillus oleivorans]|uniref:Uncharacterized protein n=1 Tax=Bacillus oleivorans TaxID=1448271 RepID=A0A285CJU7_9BACI|nr:hypothetical protein [Bacillus oleivorans]SNX67871.1 hypothetical protein SAMN05877753_10275 [Bacillus oleivorans]